jgi:hypothetical protein
MNGRLNFRQTNGSTGSVGLEQMLHLVLGIDRAVDPHKGEAACSKKS